MMKQLLMTLALAAFGLGQARTAGAEPVSSLADGRTGKIEFESITPTGFYPLGPIDIQGSLRG